ncbi:MAG TPA: carboxypeptidase-like regulatory domain-containing protein, partial [Mycobacterium sp.]|nr:carboxypeptidase-like regulatory domain-containing protein [Mycobacterium sp.]
MENVGHDFISGDSTASGDGRSAEKICQERRIPAAGQRQHQPSTTRREVHNCAGGQWTATSFQPTIVAQIRIPPSTPGQIAGGPERERERSDMTTKSRLYLGVAALAIAVVLTGSVVEVSAQQSAPPAVAIDNDDIGGVVTGASGPEAGVWVIAETTDLPTRYAKMVVTDDQGRYVVPDLPKAKYKVWVRGYGLVDSAKVDGEPGKQLNLRAVPA